ncbi:hypothetical protein C8J98_101432 [Luteibacter sp. OK325]|uniref:hypothetical protein n=1 Tax=Luteibacter sp. OK325 TaxID=2135670 RepID=UPI000D36887B|nr:hypothetical protein [Luteibacter sp. OK325]PTR35169.1 hypothetical protein C8J98_101432 [Luteibacter sp. OK325]
MRNRSRINGALAAIVALWLGITAPSFAQTSPPAGVTELAVEHDDDHMVQTWLGVALNDYANAMTQWLLDAAHANGGLVTERALVRFQQQLRRATFAYFEYTYEIDGVPYSRIYLAASGRPFATYIDPRAPGLVAPERPDAAYFASDDVVRHASAGVGEGSDVTPRTNRPGIPNRGNDAEIKVLQSIMRDIDAGFVERNGRLTGFVSKQPCDSCSAALRQFALETNAEVHVNYVHGANEDGLRTPAWTALRQARDSLVNDLTTMLTQPAAALPRAPDHPVDDDVPSTSVCGQP